MTKTPDTPPLAAVDVKLPEVTAQLDSEPPATAEPMPNDTAPGRSAEPDWYEP